MAPNRTGIKKGTRVAVEPIRKKKDIKAISQMLQGNHRDSLLWIMGINNGLRASDLVKLKVSQVINCKPGDTVIVIESKTQKPNVLVINKSVHKALQAYLKEVDPEDYLFRSKKGGHISSQSVGRLIKTWAASINLKGNYGAHTLRKTWGYHQRVNYGVGFEVLCKRYNHSSPVITMRYLGIEDKEVHNILMNEVG
jgi:integrase